MMKQLKRPLASVLAATGLVWMSLSPANASDPDKQFFDSLSGQWSGPGEIVAGKYKGTKFVCNFAGASPQGKVGMSLDGGCRVGIFNQDLSAKIEKAGSGYRGQFLDGAKGKGLDVVGGTVKGKNVVFAIHRNELTGAMRAKLSGQDTMTVTISVHVNKELVPVIGMQLKRIDGKSVGAIAQQ